MSLKTFIQRAAACASLALVLLPAWGCDSAPETSSGGTTAGPASAPSSSAPATGAPTQTQITAPLADGGFRAVITAPNPPARLRAGESVTVEARVKNAGTVAWPALGASDARFAITLRNRWLNAETGDVVNDIDGGASLPHDLAPGAETPMSIKVVAPKKAGTYTLELDMVQEQVSFFADKGSQPLRIAVKVE